MLQKVQQITKFFTKEVRQITKFSTKQVSQNTKFSTKEVQQIRKFSTKEVSQIKQIRLESFLQRKCSRLENLLQKVQGPVPQRSRQILVLILSKFSGYFKQRAATAKSNVCRHDIQRLYLKFVNVNLGKNLGIDFGKFCGTGPGRLQSLL